MNRYFLKCLLTFFCMLVTSFCYASDNDTRIEPLVIQLEPVEIVLLCPVGSQHEGELVPKWVTTDEATEFFCNDAAEEIEIAE